MRKSRKHTYKHCSASKYFIKTPRYTCSGTAFTHEARLKSQKSRRESLTRCDQLTASGGAAPESTGFARHKSFARCTRINCLLLVRETCRNFACHRMALGGCGLTFGRICRREHKSSLLWGSLHVYLSLVDFLLTLELGRRTAAFVCCMRMKQFFLPRPCVSLKWNCNSELMLRCARRSCREHILRPLVALSHSASLASHLQITQFPHPPW